jgi:hypothetical protein
MAERQREGVRGKRRREERVRERERQRERGRDNEREGKKEDQIYNLKTFIVSISPLVRVEP